MSTKLQNPKKQLMRFKLLAGSHEQQSPTDPGVREVFQAPRPFGDGKGGRDPDTIVTSDRDLEKMFNWQGIKKFERVYEGDQQQAVVAAKPALVDFNLLKSKDAKYLAEFCEKYELDVPEGKTSKDDLLKVIQTALGA